MKYKEDDYQKLIVEWLRLQKKQRKLSFAIGLEGAFNIKNRKLLSKLKALGREAGTPDLTIKLPKGITLHIELKSWTGTVNANQKEEHLLLKELGHIIYVIKEKTPREALNEIIKIIENN